MNQLRFLSNYPYYLTFYLGELKFIKYQKVVILLLRGGILRTPQLGIRLKG